MNEELALTLFSSMRLESLRAALTDESNAFRAMSGVAVQGKFGPSGLTNRRRGDRRVFLLHLLVTGIGTSETSRRDPATSAYEVKAVMWQASSEDRL